MGVEATMLDAVLRNWKQQIERADKFFGSKTEEQLQAHIAPGKNRLIYLWGHLIAVNDALLPLLGIGERLHPELDAIFLTAPDGAAEAPSANDLKAAWQQINAELDAAFTRLTPADWIDRHTSVSPEDFAKEPHRNRFNILIGRTAHLAYHLGQAKLA